MHGRLRFSRTRVCLPHNANLHNIRNVTTSFPFAAVKWDVYKTLTREDMHGEFSNAAHVCSTNEERCILNRVLAEQYARKHSRDFPDLLSPWDVRHHLREVARCPVYMHTTPLPLAKWTPRSRREGGGKEFDDGIGITYWYWGDGRQGGSRQNAFPPLSVKSRKNK